MRAKTDANRNAGDDTTEQFQDINDAYHALIDPHQKKMYDEFCAATAESRARSGRGGAAAPRRGVDGFGPPPSSRRRTDFRRTDFRREVDPGDRRSDGFAEGGTARGHGGRRGDDGRRGRGTTEEGARRSDRPAAGSPYLGLDLEIDRRAAARGGEKTATVRRPRTCRSCDGSGAVSRTCGRCGGSGSTPREDRHGNGCVAPCAECRGAGEIAEGCAECGGRGRTEETSVIRVVVPPGVRDGDVLRVTGGGDDGGRDSSPPDGGGNPHRGDLYVFLRVPGDDDDDDDRGDDGFFAAAETRGAEEEAGRRRRRENDDDVRIDLEVDAATAALGGSRPARYGRLETCRDCGGSGLEPAEWCRACRGSGVAGFAGERRPMRYDFRNAPPECPSCGGSGLRRARDCASCSGEGRTPTTTEVEVEIPAGAADGDRVRVRGAGDVTREDRGGDPSYGDLYVYLAIEVHDDDDDDVGATERTSGERRPRRSGPRASMRPSDIPPASSKPAPNDWVVIRDKHGTLDPDF